MKIGKVMLVLAAEIVVFPQLVCEQLPAQGNQVSLPPSLRAQDTTKNSSQPTGTVPEGSPQSPSLSTTIKTKTRLITVDVVAADSHGNVVSGLTNNDFKVYEGDGVQQEIAQFKFVDPRIWQNGGSASPERNRNSGLLAW